jgi:O-succinylbenzoic acid--CoA ligase
VTLSVFRAAEEAPDALAIVAEGQSLTYHDLADRAPILDHLAVLVARNDLATATRIHAIFTHDLPVLLLPPWVDGSHLAPPPQGLALVTSGSSGRPRGVVLSHRALVASAKASAAVLGWQDDDRWLACLPVCHVGGLSILTRCLIARKPAVITDRTDAASIASCIAEHRVTLVSLVPTLLARLLDSGWTPPRHLRAVILGGAHTPERLRQRALDRGVPIRTSYGMTETCSQVATQATPLDPGVGRPLPGVEARIVDGRIQVRGPMLFSRYLDHPDDRDPSGWFETGDLGRIDETGCLHVLGRADRCIITGGEKVFPEEIEAAIEACPGVVACAVVGVPDETWGERVVAVVAPSTLVERDLRAHLLSRLARFKHPRAIVLVATLPLLDGGKVDREGVRRLATVGE